MKKLFGVQIFLLLAGAIFAWYNTILNFIKFYNLEGTIFKVQDCAIPNPVTQACFYGAVGFLFAVIWAISIYRRVTIKKQQYLFWFLGAGTIFAWFNVTKEFVAFYGAKSGPALGCSNTIITNPYLTPCFTGASIFLLACILAGIIYSKLIKSNQNN